MKKFYNEGVTANYKYMPNFIEKLKFLVNVVILMLLLKQNAHNPSIILASNVLQENTSLTKMIH